MTDATEKRERVARAICKMINDQKPNRFFGARNELFAISHCAGPDCRCWEYRLELADAAIKALAEAPDYGFVVDYWDSTYPWEDRQELAEHAAPDPDQIVEIGTLSRGPSKFLARVPVVDLEREPDDWDDRVVWFDTRAEAEAALAAARTAEQKARDEDAS